MSGNDIQDKMDLLKREIVDKNYDREKFLSYCLAQKENGDDLERWTLEELKATVENFVQSQINSVNEEEKKTSSLNAFLQSSSNEKNTVINNPNISSNNNFTEVPNNSAVNNNNQEQKKGFFSEKLSKFLPQNQEKMKEKITNDLQTMSVENHNNLSTNQKLEFPCKKLEKTILNDKIITVRIQNPKASEKSLLQSSYIMYEIVTPELNWIVLRRYSDFDWLRSVLKKYYPKNLIPPIPGKKMGSRRFDLDFIEKRMKFLQIFMNEVIQNESFKSNEALVSFLSMVDRNQFERKMKELNSFIPSMYIDDMRTPTGKLTIINNPYLDNNSESEKSFDNIGKYFKLQIDILSRVNYSLKNFYRNVTVACKDLEDVQKNLETLKILNEKVRMKNEVTKTFDELSIFFKNWKRILFNQNEIINNDLKCFFKYQKMENIAYVELVDSRESLRQRILGEAIKLRSKKEKLYATNDINKWEITDDFNLIDRALLMRDKEYAFSKMCTKETQSLENLQKQLGYANHMNLQELKNIINKNQKKYVEVTKNFANEFYPTLNDGITLWSTLNTYI